MAALISSDVPGAALLLTTTISSMTPVAAKSTIADRMDSRSLYVGKTTEMRLPRHDTPLSLSVEAPRAALRADEALLETIEPGAAPLVRWYTAQPPALVIGLGLRQRAPSLLDVHAARI